MNPLLQSGGLPLFDQIRPEHVGPAITQLLDDADKALEAVTRPEFATTKPKPAKKPACRC